MSPLPALAGGIPDVIRGERMAQTDPLINYRYATDPAQSCEACVHYEPPGGCELVTGMIRPVDVCDLWEENPEGRAGAVQAAFVGAGDDEEQDEAEEAPRPLASAAQGKEPRMPVQARFAQSAPVQARWAGRHGPVRAVLAEAGTSQGAKKGWETRKSGTRKTAQLATLAKAMPAAWAAGRAAMAAAKQGYPTWGKLPPERYKAPPPISGAGSRYPMGPGQGSRAAMKKSLRGMNTEVTPPGFEPVVKALKKRGDVDNPWAVAWSMRNKGIQPKGKENEASPGSAAMGLLRKNTVRATLKDKQGHTAGIDIPEKAFKADLQRKLSLKHLMHPKKSAEAGTSQGAKKGWETRKGGGGGRGPDPFKLSPVQHERALAAGRAAKTAAVAAGADDDAAFAAFNAAYDKARPNIAKAARKERPRRVDWGGARDTLRGILQTEAGTSQGAKKGWETRKGGGGGGGEDRNVAAQARRQKMWDRPAFQRAARQVGLQRPPDVGAPPTMQDLARDLKSGSGAAKRAANMAANDAYDKAKGRAAAPVSASRRAANIAAGMARAQQMLFPPGSGSGIIRASTQRRYGGS